MITIYSVDAEGRLFTDPKQRAYIDADLLREKAVAVKTAAVLDRIARHLGYRSFDIMHTCLSCCGLAYEDMMRLIYTGKIVEMLPYITAARDYND